MTTEASTAMMTPLLLAFLVCFFSRIETIEMIIAMNASVVRKNSAASIVVLKDDAAVSMKLLRY